MKVFAKFKMSQSQIEEILQQLKNSRSEMENCLSDKAIACFELFRVPESGNVEILYWMRILKLDDDSYEVQFVSEAQTSW